MIDAGSIAIALMICLSLYDQYKCRHEAQPRPDSPVDNRISLDSIPHKEKTPVLVFSALLLFSLISGSLLYFLLGNRLIESMYLGKSIPQLNRLLAYKPNRTLQDYFYYGRIIYSRLLFVGVVTECLVLAIAFRHQLVSLVQRFFSKATHPINLAIFRIIFFWLLLDSGRVAQVVFFAHLPSELRIIPHGLAWLFNYLPLDPPTVTVIAWLYLIAAFCGMIGLWSRTSALVVTITGFYVLGIPQIFGKVNHNHNIIWFAALLAASPCGDALSCDALFAALRRAKSGGKLSLPDASTTYGAPLRFVQVLLGVIYFFPGMWKLWFGGLDWVVGENIKFQMYDKWLEDTWMPALRLDHYPVLYQLGAFGTITFELSFIFLIFLPRLYVLAPVGGFIFHHMTGMFMNIQFDLYYFYTIFFDLHSVFRRLGKSMYSKNMLVVYDDKSMTCRRAVFATRVFDILERVTYIDVNDEAGRAAHGLSAIDPATARQQLLAVVGEKRYVGVAAWRALAARIPVLWPALPLWYLWPVGRATASSRPGHGSAHGVASAARSLPTDDWDRPQIGARATWAVGVFLIAINGFYGLANDGYSWPFACFPTFARVVREPRAESIEMAVVNASGGTISIGAGPPSAQVTATRWRGLILQILDTDDTAQRAARFKALWRVWASEDPGLQEAEAVRFYRLTLTTIPERRSENPLKRELLAELKPERVPRSPAQRIQATRHQPTRDDGEGNAPGQISH